MGGFYEFAQANDGYPCFGGRLEYLHHPLSTHSHHDPARKPFPILYKQIRSGKGGKQYIIYKFRTMYQDAEKDGKVQVTHENDERITHVGGLLRRTHIG